MFSSKWINILLLVLVIWTNKLLSKYQTNAKRKSFWRKRLNEENCVVIAIIVKDGPPSFEAQKSGLNNSEMVWVLMMAEWTLKLGLSLVFHIDQTWDIIMIIHPATRKFLLWLLCKKSSETCHSVTKYVFKIQILFIYFFEIFLMTLVIWWLTFWGCIHCNAIVSKESFLKIKHVKHFRSYCSIIVHVKENEPVQNSDMWR